MSDGIVLDAYAARSCPVKTHNAFDATAVDPRSVPGWAVDEAVQDLFDGGDRFEADIVAAMAQSFGGTVADLRQVSDLPPAARSALCLHTMADGIEVIIGGLLPLDLEGHRSGAPDLLVRAADGSGYHPVEIKFHKVLERRRSRRPDPNPRPTTSASSSGPAEADLETPDPETPVPPNSTALLSTFAKPAPEHARVEVGVGYRLGSRDADLVQLAHYRAMLRSCGHAATTPLVGVIGTDDLFGEPTIIWMDLETPLLRTFSRSSPTGRITRSVQARYDHEHAFRVDIARRAQSVAGNPSTDPEPLVRPIRTKECDRCVWWSVCEPRLHPDDVSLRIDKGSLDPREITTLRRHGIETVTALAAADLDEVLTWYLPEVTHRPGGEDRIRLATRRARMVLSGHAFERISKGPVPVPAARYEIDFDLETTPENRAYLWGFLVHDTLVGGAGEYVAFSRFADLDDAAEDALAVEALSWLRDRVDAAARAGEAVVVYHYSDFEMVKVAGLAARTPGGPVGWAKDWGRATVARRAAASSGGFCDLWAVVKSHFFGAHGLGLKVVASEGAGFHWRDDDPGGLNSQRWFLDAIHAETAEIAAAARQRVLDYNEDDVIATARVRAWLRSH